MNELEEERNKRLRKISDEFRLMLAADEDNYGYLGDYEYYRRLATFVPMYQSIPRKGVVNRIKRHFYEVFTTP